MRSTPWPAATSGRESARPPASLPVNSVSLPTDGSYTHNTYLTLPLRYGLWGILALATLVIGLVMTLARGLLSSPPRQAWILAAALIALLPAIATAAFLTQTSRFAVIVGAIAGAFDALADPPDGGHDAAGDGVP